MTTRRILLAMACLPAVWLAACGGNDGIDDRTGTADPVVRLVNAVPAAPAMSLFRDDATTPENANVTGVPYKGASNYFGVSVNSHKFEAKTDTTPTVSVGTATFDAHRGNKYTLIAVPSTGSLTQLVRIDDPFDRTLATDNARVRVFDAAFNTSAIDVYLTLPNIDIATVTPQFANVGVEQAMPASGADSTEFEGATYLLRITAAGSKAVLFKAQITIDKNADLLLLPLAASVTPGNMTVLSVTSNGNPPIELTNQP